MPEMKEMTPQETMIQAILAGFLASRNGEKAQSQHLDHDTLAAFTEGTLSEREATPVVAHLVDCGFCRHITAELVRLDLAFANERLPERVGGAAAQPSKISEVLSGLLAKMFGSSADTVFAHSEDEKDDNKEPEEEKKD